MEALLSEEYCQNLCAAVHFPQQLLRTQCCSMAKQFWLQPKQPGPAQQPTVPTARRDHGTYFNNIFYQFNWKKVKFKKVQFFEIVHGCGASTAQ